jgi:hypothetical protein
MIEVLDGKEIAMRLIAALAALSLIAGCASQAERAAAVSRDVDDMMHVYGPGCEKLGYRADSDGWRECVLRLATNDRIEQRDLYGPTCVGARRGYLHCGAF